MISTLNSSVNRISGLASGLDTETLVKQLTAGTRSKIESAQQQKQLLEWKQDFYREITIKLVDFNNKYFGSSLSSLMVGDSLQQLTATSSAAEYVTAVSTTGAASQTIYISDILSLASAAGIRAPPPSRRSWPGPSTPQASPLSAESP
jgi:flagellar capping protein FliD